MTSIIPFVQRRNKNREMMIAEFDSNAKMITDMNEKFHRKHTKVTSSIHQMKDQEQFYQEIIEHHRRVIDDIVSDVESLKYDKNSMLKSISSISDSVLYKSEFETERNNIKRDIVFNQTRLHSIELELRATDNYIEKHLPYNSFKIIEGIIDFIYSNNITRIRKPEK